MHGVTDIVRAPACADRAIRREPVTAAPAPAWRPETPRPHPVRLVAAWLISAVALLVAAGIVPGAEVRGFGGAVARRGARRDRQRGHPADPRRAAAAVHGRGSASSLVLAADAAALLIAADAAARSTSTSTASARRCWSRSLASAVSTAAGAIAGIDDDATYTYRVARRVARRTGRPTATDAPGIVFLEIDGLAPARAAPRDPRRHHAGHGALAGGRQPRAWRSGRPTSRRRPARARPGSCSATTTTSRRSGGWTRRRGQVVTCSKPADCAAIEASREPGHGLLADGGTSRGNLLSGDADAAILTVSRVAADKRANPGYRAFLANGANVTRTFVLFLQEVGIELIAAARQRRRDVRPRGHRGGIYPLLRAGMCVFVRDLVAFSVLQDMFRGVPAVYATFPSYDEVAHHSGLERPDTLEALRKLDARFGMIERGAPLRAAAVRDRRALRPRPDAGRDVQAAQRLRARRARPALALAPATCAASRRGDENADGVDRAIGEATGRAAATPRADAPSVASDDGRRARLGQPRPRLPDGAPAPAHARGDRRAATPSWSRRCVRTRTSRSCSPAPPPTARSRWAPDGSRRLADGAVTGEDPLARFSPNAARHLRRTDGFPHVADLMVNSFYDPVTEEGCAFEELISFHGGLGGPQTRPFVLYPAHLPLPDEPLVGAEAVNRLFREWRAICNHEAAAPDGVAGKGAQHVPLDGLARAAGPDR